jgi:hypothetical protein
VGSSPRQDSEAPDVIRSPDSVRHTVDLSNSSVLNSWKEIARYLGRGVRTVQRWERDFGLPIRRPAGRDRSATMALTSELEEWLSTTPVRSRPNGHTGDGRLRNSPNGDDRRLSAVRVGPALVKDEPRQRHLILSVDDEPGLLYTRARILECQGYKVLSAANGERALEFLGTHPVDLVLLPNARHGRRNSCEKDETTRSNGAHHHGFGESRSRGGSCECRLFHTQRTRPGIALGGDSSISHDDDRLLQNNGTRKTQPLRLREHWHFVPDPSAKNAQQLTPWSDLLGCVPSSG